MVAIRTEDEIEKVAIASKFVARILGELRDMIKPGLSTMDLERKAIQMIGDFGVRAAFLDYGIPPYPASVCTSIDEEVVHGIPDIKRVLKTGNIISMDFGVETGGYFGDSAITVMVGNVSSEKRRLCEVTERALHEGICQAREGNHLGDISAAIQSCVESNGYSVVREFVGHGIGARLHEDPQIPNFGNKGTGILLKSGMILAIEPMVNVGESDVRVLDDGWTAVTTDGCPSAHFEHTVVVTRDKPRILTLIT